MSDSLELDGTRPPRVLLVDDDPVSLELMRRALRDCDTLAVTNGLAAIAAVVRERPRVVVLEVGLEGLSGFEVCKTLRRGGLDLPILLVSGRMVRSADRIKGLLLGGSDFLVKPFEPVRLAMKVRELLAATSSGAPVPLDLDVRALVDGGRGPLVDVEAFGAKVAEAHELSRTVRLPLALVGLDGSEARYPDAWEALAAELETGLRAEDLMSRVGDRKLALLLLDADVAGAERALERVLDRDDPELKGIEVRVVVIGPDDAPADPADWIGRALGGPP